MVHGPSGTRASDIHVLGCVCGLLEVSFLASLTPSGCWKDLECPRPQGTGTQVKTLPRLGGSTAKAKVANLQNSKSRRQLPCSRRFLILFTIVHLCHRALQAYESPAPVKPSAYKLLRVTQQCLSPVASHVMSWATMKPTFSPRGTMACRMAFQT